MTRAVHHVGFRDGRHRNAYGVFGGPRFIHPHRDRRARREIGPDEAVAFAEGEWTQGPRPRNAPDGEEGA